jgi:hypothetical protein
VTAQVCPVCEGPVGDPPVTLVLREIYEERTPGVCIECFCSAFRGAIDVAESYAAAFRAEHDPAAFSELRGQPRT